jgi:hypothetical protein
MTPKKIKVGQATYTVHLLPENHTDTYGVCLSNHQRIYLSRNQKWEQAGNTLLHELMHAIYHQSGLCAIPNPDEETIVNIMATWTHMVLVENPDVADFVLNTEQRWSYGPVTDPDEEATADE